MNYCINVHVHQYVYLHFALDLTYISELNAVLLALLEMAVELFLSIRFELDELRQQNICLINLNSHGFAIYLEYTSVFQWELFYL